MIIVPTLNIVTRIIAFQVSSDKKIAHLGNMLYYSKPSKHAIVKKIQPYKINLLHIMINQQLNQIGNFHKNGLRGIEISGNTGKISCLMLGNSQIVIRHLNKVKLK